MSTLVDAATIATALAVPATGWLFSRISKARQLETNRAITQAVDQSETAIKGHVDQRIDELKRSIDTVDSREQDTRQKLAHLQGRFDQAMQQPLGGGG